METLAWVLADRRRYQRARRLARIGQLPQRRERGGQG
jgi:hypothetical protein